MLLSLGYLKSHGVIGFLMRFEVLPQVIWNVPDEVQALLLIISEAMTAKNETFICVGSPATYRLPLLHSQQAGCYIIQCQGSLVFRSRLWC